MASKRNSPAKAQSLDSVSSTSKVTIKEAANSQEAGNASSEPEREAEQGASGEEAYQAAGSQYVQQYYAQYMHLYQVLDRGLTAIHSELYYISKKMQRMTDSVKECSDTIDFYVTRKLSFQKEMLQAVGTTNGFLQAAVRLLRDIREDRGSANSTDRVERHVSEESDEDGPGRKEREKRHRSRSGDRSARHRRRYSDRK